MYNKTVKNLYEPSKIISIEEFGKIGKALKKSWSAETATFADDDKKWSKDNPAYGQCMVTAVLISDMFGGKLVYDGVNYHYWNELPDKTRQDFTRQQFRTKTKLVLTKYKTKDEVLNDAHAKKHDSKGRYALLKRKFRKAYEAHSLI